MPRGQALGYTMNLPEEDRYLQSTEELRDWLKVILAGRAAEQVVFGRITNGAANDLERATAIARSMVFEWGMGESMPHQQVRADNYALSEETKRTRDAEQRGITDAAYRDALRLVEHHREYLDRLAHALLATETLERPEIDRLLQGLEPESNSSLTSASRRRGRAAAAAPRLRAARRLRRCRPAAVAGGLRGRGLAAGAARHLFGRALDGVGRRRVGPAVALDRGDLLLLRGDLRADVCDLRGRAGKLARPLGERVCLVQAVRLAAELVQRVALVAVQVAELHVELPDLATS